MMMMTTMIMCHEDDNDNDDGSCDGDDEPDDDDDYVEDNDDGDDDDGDGNDEQDDDYIQDNDNDFFVMGSADDVSICRGDWTDSYGLVSSTTVLPDIGRGQYPFGWWIFDIDGDFTAEGTDPTNWDTDGDWMVDWFEVSDDEDDDIRGDSSPIRYDSRNTA